MLQEDASYSNEEENKGKKTRSLLWRMLQPNNCKVMLDIMTYQNPATQLVSNLFLNTMKLVAIH